ncbi:quinone oxidoreductase family protein [Paenirhodobacter sp.]|uniref:quinone oxidoreductase family protein n=1 Tax=Paenirhodobacter sp. TaxID=1965326 RepID=UPI003B413945
MKAAVVTGAGQAPVCAEFPAPSPEPGEVLVNVRAAAISPLVRARASGRHYSFDGRYPFVAGFDGVGVLPDGRRVYFAMPRAPFGAMAEQVPVQAERCVPLPDGIDDIRAAALANPGMSSWMALRERARIQPGETVLVNGATGASGQLAVRIARHMGARRVIATGRNPEVLAQLPADAVIPLSDQQALTEAVAAGVDVVLDYLWGPSARVILEAATHARPADHPCRFVQIGAISGEEIALPGSWLRSAAIELMGSGLGSVPMPRMLAAVREMLAAGLDIPTRAVPLAEITPAWADATDLRQVVTIG